MYINLQVALDSPLNVLIPKRKLKKKEKTNHCETRLSLDLQLTFNNDVVLFHQFCAQCVDYNLCINISKFWFLQLQADTRRCANRESVSLWQGAKHAWTFNVKIDGIAKLAQVVVLVNKARAPWLRCPKLARWSTAVAQGKRGSCCARSLARACEAALGASCGPIRKMRLPPSAWRRSSLPGPWWSSLAWWCCSSS